MAALAAVGHATERHLLRLFIDHAGVSPLHYLRRIRLERARLSIECGATVTRAAEVAGFRSGLQLRRAWSGTGVGRRVTQRGRRSHRDVAAWYELPRTTQLPRVTAPAIL